MERLAIVVATKNRPVEFERFLKSLKAQRYENFTLIVVESGERFAEEILKKEAPDFHYEYIYSEISSSTYQRNLGVERAKGKYEFIAFMDDDIILYDDSLENFFMVEKHYPDVAGFSFTMVNHPSMFMEKWKRRYVVNRLGLYSPFPGDVPPSGFQTMILPPKEPLYTKWLPTTCTFWRSFIFDKVQFDEWFRGYGYLEDLDFSYSVYKEGYKLLVLPECKYEHLPGQSGRGNGFEFGKREIFNRLYFVKKHKELSVYSAYLGLFVRTFISLLDFMRYRRKYDFMRTLGNIYGILMSR